MKFTEYNITLSYIDVNEFEEKIYHYYLEAFPEDERKPLELIKSSYNRGYTKIIKVLDENVIIGFMILNRINNSSYAVLDYLCILPQYRNRNFGTSALHLLIEQESKSHGIFIEVEKVGFGKDEEDNALRKKRQQFYERLGFKKLNYDLLLFDVMYMPYVFSNINMDEELVISEVLDIYETISGRDRIKRNCRFIKN